MSKESKSLTNPPDGGKVRRPWEAIGMSRASWYRHGKPTEKPKRKTTHADIAKICGCSVRTIQRDRAQMLREVVEDARKFIAQGHSLEDATRMANEKHGLKTPP
jgi:hypothetical protein